MTEFMNSVTKELQALKAVGIRVPAKAIKASKDSSVMAEFADMSVSDAADLLLDLY